MIVSPDCTTDLTSAQIGGKAASLFALVRRGFQVPPFFVLTVDAYEASEAGKVGRELREQILRALQTIGGSDAAYAVRSSGVAEDSADFSYAGVFETILDVRGEDDLIAAVERCWASHGSEIAQSYRQRRGVLEDAAMAVVVQRMVQAEWSGVSFSADPITQALSVCVINATQGLGERLVSGLVNPHQIRVDNNSGAILDETLPPGMQPLPAPIREEVARQTLRAADSFGFPQDLEWATEGSTVFILQSRPITTVSGVFHNRSLEPWSGHGRPDAPERVWTRAYADEVWAPPLTPLFYDIQNLTTVTGQQLANSGDTAPLPPDTFKYYRAAAYMDVEVLRRLFATLPRVARRPSLFTLLSPERRADLASAPWNWRGTLKRLWKFEMREGRTRGLTRNYRFLEAAWPAFLSRARELCDTDLTRLDDGKLDEFLGKAWELAGSVAPECEVAVLYYANDLRLLLTGLLDRWCADGDRLYAEVSSGLENSETVRETDAIWELARAIRGSGEETLELARTSDWKGFRAREDFPGVAAISAGFAAFVRQHGHRGANYKDPIYPRWGDDPELLWTHVQAFLSAPGTRPSEINAASGARRVAAQKAVLSGLRGPFAGLKRRALRALFRGNEIYAGLRDNHRFYYDHVWWLVRRVYLEKGRRLAAAGLLAGADEVVFLSRPEIEQLRAGTLPASLAVTRIGLRRREWQETRARVPPRYLRRGYVPDEGVSSVASEDGKRLHGLAASPGLVRARARIVLDVAELAHVADGDILIARQTDPGWTPAFARLAGLVLETGGVLAHGASLCREYGLPCVTAVDGATSRILDGDMICLSGNEGWVDIL